MLHKLYDDELTSIINALFQNSMTVYYCRDLLCCPTLLQTVGITSTSRVYWLLFTHRSACQIWFHCCHCLLVYLFPISPSNV